MRILFSLFWIAGAVASWMQYRSDDQKREASNAFVQEYAVVVRRPAHAETIHFAPAADLASEVAADVALQDATRSVDLNQMDTETRQAWIEAVPRYGDELADAHTLLLSAIRERPGWPFHRALLGEIEFVRAERERRIAQSADRWLKPLVSAIAGSPGEQSFAVFAASSVIKARRPDLLTEARPVIASAMRDPDFVRSSYLDLIELIGHDAVFALLPDEPAPLRVAIQSEAEVADVEAVSQLFPRWERSEWRDREKDLGKISQRVLLNDVQGVRQASSAWLSTHSLTDFDTRAGRAQVARLLDLWPDEPGRWPSDARTNLIFFFLNGRQSDVDARSIARAASWLSDVPAHVAARVALLSGDVAGSEALARKSETAGSFEWTKFYVELAQHHLRAKRRAEAAAALALVAPAAQSECDVVVTRRALSGESESGEMMYTGNEWSRGHLPICVDRAGRRLSSTFAVAEIPALISYGFNDGRFATALLPPGRSTLAIPIDSPPGRTIFSFETVAGGEVQPTVAALR